MSKYKALLFELAVIFIITVPAFFALLNNSYFSMHDDQHIARLFLLDQGLKQGILYPRWVDMLGFGYGYPLYNFYPPLIYYVAEIFHLMGFSLIWSIKMLIISGTALGAWGVYLLSKKCIGKAAGFVSSIFYTFSLYHAVLIFVRGALAEFFAASLLPFVFITLINIFEKPSRKNTILFAVIFSLLIVAHPLVALPSLLFICLFILFYAARATEKLKMFMSSMSGIIMGIGMSSFFWLPSLAEKKHTLTDIILTSELASYKLHFVYPQQLWHSPWGFGGSAQGITDGISFQFGKIYILIFLLSLIFFVVSLLNLSRVPQNKKKEMASRSSHYILFLLCFAFSIFMTTEYSSLIWDQFNPLWFLQFPWRFLTFSSFFLSLCCGYFIFFISHTIHKLNTQKNLLILGAIIAIIPMVVYQKYFKPQYYITTSDSKRTSYEEIAWRISRTSHEFVPKKTATTKTELDTTVVDITKDKIPRNLYSIISGAAEVHIIKNNFNKKILLINAADNTTIQLNTYNFPGWKLFVNNKIKHIESNNKYQLITFSIPKGKHTVALLFTRTPVRLFAESVTLISLMLALYVFFYRGNTSAK